MGRIKAYSNKRREILVSCTAVIFVLGMEISSVIDSKEIMMFWGGVALVSAGVGIYITNWTLKKEELLLFWLILFFGWANWGSVGNIELYRIIYISISVFIAKLFMSDCLNVKYIKLVFFADVFFVCLFFWINGVGSRLYFGSSENAISVHMVALTVLYYSLSEKFDDHISPIPAFLNFCVCVLGRGRGGIFVSMFLLVGIMLYKCYRREIAWKSGTFLFSVCLLVYLLTVYLNVDIDILQSHSVFSHFKRSGVWSSERIQIWSEYVWVTFGDPINFLIGTDMSKSSLLFNQYKANPHNSFLSLHAMHGAGTFFFVLILIAKSFWDNYKNGNVISILCLATIVLRALTDKMIWGPKMTPIFFLLLFLRNDRNRMGAKIS